MTDRLSGMASAAVSAPPGEWVDTALLAGNDTEVCLCMGRPVTRLELRALVGQHQDMLAGAGLGAGGTAALVLPPSLAYVATLLAAWRLGAQVSLLDHRLARGEVDRALSRLAAQVTVTPAHRGHREGAGGPLGPSRARDTRLSEPPGASRRVSPRNSS
jgi:3-hydroxy-4-methylanthranilate adenylyltransferase